MLGLRILKVLGWHLTGRYFVRFYPQEQVCAVLTAKTACPNLEALVRAGGVRFTITLLYLFLRREGDLLLELQRLDTELILASSLSHPVTATRGGQTSTRLPRLTPPLPVPAAARCRTRPASRTPYHSTSLVVGDEVGALLPRQPPCSTGEASSAILEAMLTCIAPLVPSDYAQPS